jgi:hypothetical protein
MVAAGQPGHPAGVDQLLPQQGIGHLRADLQIVSDLGDRPPSGNQSRTFRRNSAG